MLNDCPLCGEPVERAQRGMKKAVLWEGRTVWGHRGCIADVVRARALDRDLAEREDYDPSEASFSEQYVRGVEFVD